MPLKGVDFYMEKLLIPKKVTGFLKIYEITLYPLVKEVKIPAFKIGKQLRFNKEKFLKIYFNGEK